MAADEFYSSAKNCLKCNGVLRSYPALWLLLKLLLGESSWASHLLYHSLNELQQHKKYYSRRDLLLIKKEN